MSLTNKKFWMILLVILFILAAWFIYYKKTSTNTALVPKDTATDQLKIVSTNPNPLNGATILPNQNIEITFNKEIVKSEFKNRFDQEISYDVEAVDKIGSNKDISKTFKIVFKKPLELGHGFTFSVLSNTHTENGLKLNEDQSFSFKTINYNGI